MRQLSAWGAVIVLAAACAVPLAGQTNGEPAATPTSIDSYKLFTDHPRLFLRPQRLRLLRRERERKSLRWDQFHLLMAGGAPMPEPGFADALYFAVTDEAEFARRAVKWATAPGRDLRQVALVYDWCQSALSAAEKQTLAARLHTGMVSTADRSLAGWRSRVLAAVALGEDDSGAEKTLQQFVTQEWLGRIISGIRDGKSVLAASEHYALFEILHAFRDNLNVDLREDSAAFFRQLPLLQLLSYYPPPYPAPENEFHIPFSPVVAEPDLKIAAFSRSSELAMVAFDSNAPSSQVLQGWLMNDRFLMRGTLGIVYEFLWANPYQPGLSYYHVPLVLHDEILGQLVVRSSWDDDARWAGYLDGKLQEFRDGAVVLGEAGTARAPIDLDEATIVFTAQSRTFETGAREISDVFLIGLKPRSPFHIEIQSEEMFEARSDPGGIIYLKGVPAKTWIRITAVPGRGVGEPTPRETPR